MEKNMEGEDEVDEGEDIKPRQVYIIASKNIFKESR